MLIFMSMFTGAVVMMNRAVTKTESVTRSASSVNQAFLTLDRTVRYAATINQPAKGTDGAWYVELRITNTGADFCTQLRIDVARKQLQSRRWQVVGTVASPTDPAFVPLADGITNGTAVAGPNQPFTLLGSAGDAAVYQQLAVKLVSTSGSGPTLTSSQSTLVFTAVNSSIPVAGAPAVCQQVRRP